MDALYPTHPSGVKELSPLAEGSWLLMVHNSVALLKLSPAEGSYLAQEYDSLWGQHDPKDPDPLSQLGTIPKDHPSSQGLSGIY